MRKTLMVASLALVLATAGCYTSRRVAGDHLNGGLWNPYLWVTVPIDTLTSPYQIYVWANDDTDDWSPWLLDADRERDKYIPDRPFYTDFMAQRAGR